MINDQNLCTPRISIMIFAIVLKKTMISHSLFYTGYMFVTSHREWTDGKKRIPLKSMAEYSSLSSNLQTHLEKEEKDQRNKKQKK